MKKRPCRDSESTKLACVHSSKTITRRTNRQADGQTNKQKQQQEQDEKEEVIRDLARIHFVRKVLINSFVHFLIHVFIPRKFYPHRDPPVRRQQAPQCPEDDETLRSKKTKYKEKIKTRRRRTCGWFEVTRRRKHRSN